MRWLRSPERVCFVFASCLVVAALALLVIAPLTPQLLGLDSAIRLFGGNDLWHAKGPDYASAQILTQVVPWLVALLTFGLLLLLAGLGVHWSRRRKSQ